MLAGNRVVLMGTAETVVQQDVCTDVETRPVPTKTITNYDR